MMSYDVKCRELALAFINDFSDAALPHPREKLVDELAQRIQDAVESYIEAEIITMSRTAPDPRAPWPFPSTRSPKPPPAPKGLRYMDAQSLVRVYSFRERRTAWVARTHG